MPHAEMTLALARVISLDPFVADPDWVGTASPPSSDIMESGVDSDDGGFAYTVLVKDAGGDTLGAAGSVSVTLVELLDNDASCCQGDVLSLAVGKMRYEPGLGAMRFAFRISGVSGLDVLGTTLEIWWRCTP